LSYWAEYTLYATPAVGDTDGDGDAEVVIGGHNPDNPNQGMLFAWTGHPVDARPSWPTWRQNVRHTGLLMFDTLPPTNPTSLSSPSHTRAVWLIPGRCRPPGRAPPTTGRGCRLFDRWDSAPNTLPDEVLDLPAE
jgi:hypothetical protein